MIIACMPAILLRSGRFPTGSSWEGGKLSFVLAASMSDGTERFIHSCQKLISSIQHLQQAGCNGITKSHAGDGGKKGNGKTSDATRALCSGKVQMMAAAGPSCSSLVASLLPAVGSLLLRLELAAYSLTAGEGLSRPHGPHRLGLSH